MSISVCVCVCVCVSRVHVSMMQVHIPTQLHATGAVGHRLRDPGGHHSSDHPSEQESLSGPH